MNKIENQDTYEFLEEYEEYKKDIIFDLSYELHDYCRKYNPLLLEYSISSDLVDLLVDFVDIKNPFILEDDDIESDEDDYEEMF